MPARRRGVIVNMMASIAYEITGDGIYVQTHFSKPDDQDWSEMLSFVRMRGADIRAVIVAGRDGATPSLTQRQLLALEIGKLSADARFALLIDSRFSRGALMALSWVTGRTETMRPFPHSELENALEFLELSESAKEAVRGALAHQSGGVASQVG